MIKGSGEFGRPEITSERNVNLLPQSTGLTLCGVRGLYKTESNAQYKTRSGYEKYNSLETYWAFARNQNY